MSIVGTADRVNFNAFTAFGLNVQNNAFFKTSSLCFLKRFFLAISHMLDLFIKKKKKLSVGNE